MSFVKYSLLFAISTTLSGCFSSGEWMTRNYHPAPDYEYRDCKRYAADYATDYLDNSGSYDQSSALAAVAASIVAAGALKDSCMKNKGYVWIDSDSDYAKKIQSDDNIKELKPILDDEII